MLWLLAWLNVTVIVSLTWYDAALVRRVTVPAVAVGKSAVVAVDRGVVVGLCVTVGESPGVTVDEG